MTNRSRAKMAKPFVGSANVKILIPPFLGGGYPPM